MDQSTGIKECPKCGGTEFGKGKQRDYAALRHPTKIFSIGSAIMYVLCTDCGFIIESFVEKPERFKRTL